MKSTNTVWAKKSIIWDFAISNLKIKYRSSVLGFIWSFLEPLLLLTVLYIVFTNVFESTIEHFPLYLLLGLIIWNMFGNGTRLAIDSMLVRGPLLIQIHIPNEVPAISSAITSLLMISLEMIVFGIFLVAFQFVPPYTIVILPLIVLLNFMLVLGFSLPLSLLNIKFRDTQFIWTVILTAGFFLNPIFYKVEILPQEIQSILAFSPMLHILNFARDAVLYGTLPTVENIALAVGMTALIFGVGFGIFKKLSPRIIEEL